MSPDHDHHLPGGDILVVDDTAGNLKLLAAVLSSADYRVRPVNNGESALRSVQTQLPALILLDVQMPDLNGYEVCQRLKADERTRDIPVIFLSVLDDSADKLRAFEVGGVDYITKPFHPAEVLARVKTHIALCEMRNRLQQVNRELEQRLQELEAATDHIRTLQGIVPICMHCHRIRNDQASWQKLEEYIQAHSDAQFSHGLCPECQAKYYPKASRDAATGNAGPRQAGV